MTLPVTRILLAAAIGVTAAAHENSVQAADTITDFVLETGAGFDANPFDYDILLKAVVTAELAGALADENADYTLFAPNDSAFYRLARDLGYVGQYNEEEVWLFLVEALTVLGDDDPIPVLTNVLLYHVSPGSKSLFRVVLLSFLSQPIETLLEGATFKPFFVVLIDNDPDVRNPRVFLPLNVRTGNGIVHTINRVLLPIDVPNISLESSVREVVGGRARSGR